MFVWIVSVFFSRVVWVYLVFMCMLKWVLSVVIWFCDVCIVKGWGGMWVFVVVFIRIWFWWRFSVCWCVLRCSERWVLVLSMILLLLGRCVWWCLLMVVCSVGLFVVGCSRC